MNKIKNIMLTIITAISIILLIGIISYYTEAKSSPIPDNIDSIKKDDKFTYSLTDLSNGRRQGKLFCVQHRQEMSQWKDINYTATNIVTIKGMTAEAFKRMEQKLHQNQMNGMLGWLLLSIILKQGRLMTIIQTNDKKLYGIIYTIGWIM